MSEPLKDEDEATDDVENYSDKATLTGDLRWAVCAKHYAAHRVPNAPATTRREGE